MQEDAGDHRKFGADGAVIFSTGLPVDAFGQFVLSKPVPNLQSEVLALDRSLENSGRVAVSRVFPNPAAANGLLWVETDQSGPVVFRLFDEKGRAIRVEKFEGKTRVELNGLSAGTYAYSIEGERTIAFGRIVVD